VSRRRFLLVTVIATLLICVSVIIAVNFRGWQISYHRWQLHRADQQMAEGTAGRYDRVTSAPAGSFERHMYHIKKLVLLGAVTERLYKFKHLKYPTPESSHFTHLLLSGTCPNRIDATYLCPREPELLNVTVWCETEDASAWDDFVEKHDTLDYRTQFMPSE
jgi:hypothetical protein